MNAKLWAPALLLSAAACAPLETDEVAQGATRVARPDPGMRVWQEVLFDDGRTETLEVFARDDDGVLELVHVPRDLDIDGRRHLLRSSDGHDEVVDDEENDDDVVDGDGVDGDVVASEALGSTSVAATTSPSKCRDTAFTLMGHRWSTTFAWRFRASSIPSSLTADRTEQALRAAMVNITRQDNRCGAADLVEAKASYKGRTSDNAQVTASGACSGNDGKNVVAFGDLPAGVLGVACVWSTSDGEAVSADVRFNKVDHRWTNAPGSPSCRGRYDVESVATHEFGHVFGVGHVSEETHGRLVMSTAINGTCQSGERSLGSGDMRALRALY